MEHGRRSLTYRIMHKDRCVAEISDTGLVSVHSTAFMPFSLYFETDDDIDSRVINLNNFFYWCSSRLLTLDRTYAKEIMNSIGQQQAVTDRDRAQIALKYHCLSLTDVYWVQSASENLSFSDISLYSHSLSDAFVDVSLRGKMLTAQNAALLADRDAAGDLSTAGIAPKAWRRIGGTFYLYKDGSKRDVNAEILSSKILDCFSINHVSYTEDYFDGEKVSVSKLMTSEQYSIVPMEAVAIYAANHDTTLLNIVLEKDPDGFYAMNIVDYLLGNTDRHWGNWGFLVNNEDNSLMKLHPLMDFNKAFLSYTSLDGARCLTLSEPKSQREAAVDAVHRFPLIQISDVQKDWFENEQQFSMFQSRLSVLRATNF